MLQHVFEALFPAFDPNVAGDIAATQIVPPDPQTLLTLGNIPEKHIEPDFVVLHISGLD